MKSLSKKYLGLLSLCLIFISILICVLVKTIIFKTTKVRLVETEVGSIQGYLGPKGEYYSFLGVPYAMINKSMPFGESLEYPPFTDVFKANDGNKLCPQQDIYDNKIKGNLDCLRLDIFVPKNASIENRMPVLVYIDGGQHKVTFVADEYKAKNLLNNDIIFVAINYRLGPYGFMCLDIPEVPGNQGLKDQIKALRWIKQNIEDFGGDPDRITVAGSSSGGQDVLLHLVYGEEKLFNQAIIDSGIVADYHAVKEPNTSTVIKIASDLGFNTNVVRDALNFLSLQDSHKVIDASEKLNINYSPCIEKDFTEKSVITNFLTPLNQMKNIENMPILVSQAINEKLIDYADKTLEDDEYQNIFEDKLYDLFDLDAERLHKMSARVRQFYIGDEEIGTSVKQRIIDFISDLDSNYPTQNFLKRCLESGFDKIYHHVFSYTGDLNLLRQTFKIDSRYQGATHVDQIGYLFEMSGYNHTVTREDQLIVNRTAKLWSNFVKYGDPVPKTSRLLPVKCQTVTNESITYLKIDKDFRCGVNLFHNRMAYWDLFYHFNRNYERKHTNMAVDLEN